MTRQARRPVAVVTATLLLTTLGATTAATALPTRAATAAAVVTEDDPAAGKLLLMLDASGSMNEKDPSGGTKMTAAKKALTSVVDSLPDTTQVGLRVYGAKEPGGKPTPKACKDTQLVAPIAPLDKPALTKAIKGFQAKGETPIAYSLEQALKDVGTDGKRNIVLVSDGEESCTPDPCPAIKKLVGQGIDLQIDTVGFGVGDKARKQLQCLADAGHGTYYDAADADALTTSLTKLSQRALRPYSFAGTPIDGTAKQADAPALTPGQHLDQIPVDKNGVWYRIERTPGSTVRLAATSRPGFGSLFDTESVVAELKTGDGASCGRKHDFRIDAYFSTAQPVTVVPRTRTPKPDESIPRADACLNDPVLYANVSRTKGLEGDAPVELVLVEESPVTNIADLEEAPSEETPKPAAVKAADTAQPIVGGTSFNDGPTLTPGTYEDVVIPGESLYYRVHLEEGQQAVWTLELPTEGTSLPERSTTGISAYVHGPDRGQIQHEAFNVGEHGSARDTPPSVWTPTVRYQNRWPNGVKDAGIGSVNLGHASMAGDYTLALHTGALGKKNEALPQAPFRIHVAVLGEPATAPSYEDEVAGTSPSPSTTGAEESAEGDTPTDDKVTAGEAAREDDGGIPWLLVGLGGLTLVTGAAALALVLRGRRRPEHP